MVKLYIQCKRLFKRIMVYNAATGKHIMWFEDRPDAITSSGYFVATSTQPNGPCQAELHRCRLAEHP